MGFLHLFSFLLTIFFAQLAQGLFAPEKFSANNSGGVHITSYSVLSPSPHPHPLETFSPKRLYFSDPQRRIDDALSWEDGTGIVNLFQKCPEDLKHIQNFVHSTNTFLTNIAELSLAADSLDKANLNDSHLYLSFRFVDKNGRIPPERFAEAFNSLSVQITEEKVASLKKHVSGIFLDLRQPPFSRMDYMGMKDSPDYATTWDISLVKYAKKFSRKVLGIAKSHTDFKVGVQFNSKYDLFNMELRQQSKGADMYVFKMIMEMGVNVPLTYEKFRFMLSRRINSIKEIFQNELKINETKIMLEINFIRPQPNNFPTALKRNVREQLGQVLKESEAGSFALLRKFAGRWTEEGKSDLIFNRILNSDGEEETSKRDPKSHGIMPSFHVQEVDVTACQLITMLCQSAKKSRSIVVNEFTWVTFANYETEVFNCPKALELPFFPPSVYLTFTSGSGSLWNNTENLFEELFTNHQTIAGWKLGTLIFPAEDVLLSTTSIDTGMVRFAREMQEMYAIGCLVEFPLPLIVPTFRGNLVEHINKTTLAGCDPIWTESSVIVWHVQITNYDRFINFELSLGGKVRYALLRVLVARAKFISEYPDKEVILQISLENIDQLIERFRRHANETSSGPEPECHTGIAILHEFYRGVEAWAEIHGVKVILPPAYHIQNPVRGLWQLPDADGAPSTVNWNKCTDSLNNCSMKATSMLF